MTISAYQKPLYLHFAIFEKCIFSYQKIISWTKTSALHIWTFSPSAQNEKKIFPDFKSNSTPNQSIKNKNLLDT